MPHAALKLIPGVDTNKTPALNESAISEGQFIRFIPDRTLGGLVQKLGGWTKYFGNQIGSTVRALWAWEDTNSNSYLAVGAEGAVGGSALSVINSNVLNDITPQVDDFDVAVSVSTVAGSNEVTITDTGRNVDDYDVVYIRTQISVGGIVLFGKYQCYNPGGSANTYRIYPLDILGDPLLAVATITNGGAVPEIDTVINNDFVTVTLGSHGYEVGSTFTVLIATTVGGITFYGNYIVRDVPSSNTFVISASVQASSTATGFINNGDANYYYYNGSGPLPQGSGYGILGYGEGGYGTGIPPAASSGTPILAEDWTLDNWGQILISCPLNGSIYAWDPTSGDETALVIPEAPPANHGVFVAMPQRQIIAWGSTFTGIHDPLLIRWCDVNNYNQWLALITNQAGSYRIPKGSRIVQCIQGPQQGLIWTDLGVWAMQYTGPPYIYSFNELGNGCGLIGRKAATSIGGTVYWMGPSQFFKLAGNGVESIRCPVWDVIFQDIDTDYADNIRVAPNSRFAEISWFYPTVGSGGQPTKYVKYNILLDCWDFGTLCRTAWINESVLGPPIGACGLTQFIFQHETSPNADGLAMNSYFQTGYFVLTEANEKMFVDQIWPDMKWGYYGGSQEANITLEFFVTDYPGQTPIQYGPFTMTQAVTYITPRFRGRLVSIRIESNDIDSWWRMGGIRYRFQPDGRY
jgi:hypothetical protein